MKPFLLLICFLTLSLSAEESLNNDHARFCIGQIDGFEGSSVFMLDTQAGRLWQFERDKKGGVGYLKEIPRIDLDTLK